VLIADEPTTALDAATQGEVLDLLARLRVSRSLSWILVSHDLTLAERYADRLAVFHEGRVVETGPVAEVLAAPGHHHTRELIRARRPPRGAPPAQGRVVLNAQGLAKTYPGASKPALVDASIQVRAGQIVGVVGQSGSGKTTLARCLVGLERPSGGRVVYPGPDGAPGPWTPSRAQLVFQNPYTSLNPSLTVRQTLTEAVRAARRQQDGIVPDASGGSVRPGVPAPGPVADPAGSGLTGWAARAARAARVAELLGLVGLDASLADRKPGQLSGGQRQRVAIARALAMSPQVLICDEAVSALDAAVQDQVLLTLLGLRQRLGQAMVFISHDLDVVARIADWVHVMHQGEIVEQGPPDRVLSEPKHAYTKTLIGAHR
jgi:peptide/nickel transport system ATP-binding protein